MTAATSSSKNSQLKQTYFIWLPLAHLNRSVQHLHEKLCFITSQAVSKEQIPEYTEICTVIIAATSYIRNKESITLCLKSNMDPYPLPWIKLQVILHLKSHKIKWNFLLNT